MRVRIGKEEGRSGYAVFAALTQSLKGLASRRRGNGMELGSSDVEKVLRFDRKRLKGLHRLFGGAFPF